MNQIDSECYRPDRTYDFCCLLAVFSVFKEVSDYVKQGQVIMKCGSTGWSTAPHLHFTIRINGALVDPCDYVRP